MQIGVFDYSDGSITIFNLSKEIEKLCKEDKDFSLTEYVEMLPGYSSYCYFMAADNIKVRFGNQEDFPEFSGNDE